MNCAESDLGTGLELGCGTAEKRLNTVIWLQIWANLLIMVVRASASGCTEHTDMLFG
jgi:hypothetical protein